MNKYRTHNCSELTEKDNNKSCYFIWMGAQKTGPWKFIIYRFKRSFWIDTMRSRK